MIPRSAITSSPNAAFLHDDSEHHRKTSCCSSTGSAFHQLPALLPVMKRGDSVPSQQECTSAGWLMNEEVSTFKTSIPPELTGSDVSVSLSPEDEAMIIPAVAANTLELPSPKSALEVPGAAPHRKSTTTSLPNTTTTTTTTKKKQVSWGTVQVRRHAILPGDHPDSSNGGPPLSIDWTPLSERRVPLDQFEWERAPHRAHSSEAGRELILPAGLRYELLRRSGASDAEIWRSLRQSQQTRAQRVETVRDFGWTGWHEFAEGVRRLFRPPVPRLETKY